MKFAGYRVFGTGAGVWLCATEFDETELSDTSDWTEAWQNGEGQDDGFVINAAGALVRNICDRLLDTGKHYAHIEPNASEPDRVLRIDSVTALAGFLKDLPLDGRPESSAATKPGAPVREGPDIPL